MGWKRCCLSQIWALFKCIWETKDLAYYLHTCRSVYIVTNLKTNNLSDETTPEARENHRSPDLRNGTSSSSSLVGRSGLGMWGKRSRCHLLATAVWTAGESSSFLSWSSLAGSLSLISPVTYGRQALESGVSSDDFTLTHRALCSTFYTATYFSAIFKHTCSLTYPTPVQPSTSNFYCPFFFLPGDRLAAT